MIRMRRMARILRLLRNQTRIKLIPTGYVFWIYVWRLLTIWLLQQQKNTHT